MIVLVTITCSLYLNKIPKEALLVMLFILSIIFLLQYYLFSTVLKLNNYLVNLYTEHIKSFKEISLINKDETIFKICDEVLKEQI
jgi:hypothetical protein